MKGRVESGSLVTLEPRAPEALSVDDIVLVKVGGNVYLHLIKAIDGDRFQIGNNHNKINGWVGANCIYGVAVRIEP